MMLSDARKNPKPDSRQTMAWPIHNTWISGGIGQQDEMQSPGTLHGAPS